LRQRDPTIRLPARRVHRTSTRRLRTRYAAKRHQPTNARDYARAEARRDACGCRLLRNGGRPRMTSPNKNGRDSAVRQRLLGVHELNARLQFVEIGVEIPLERSSLIVSPPLTFGKPFAKRCFNFKQSAPGVVCRDRVTESVGSKRRLPATRRVRFERQVQDPPYPTGSRKAASLLPRS